MKNRKPYPNESREARAMATLAAAALRDSENIDLGYFFEVTLNSGDIPVGRFSITVKRIGNR